MYAMFHAAFLVLFPSSVGDPEFDIESVLELKYKSNEIKDSLKVLSSKKKRKLETKKNTQDKKGVKLKIETIADKKPRNKNAGKDNEKERIPKGFSIRRRPQKAGPHPKCRGCGHEVEYNKKAVKHSIRSKSHTGKTLTNVRTYHASSQCLQMFSPTDIKNIECFLE